MSALTKKMGKDLATGATASPVAKTYSQSSRDAAAGELRIIHDEDGNDISVYVADPHKEMSFEAVMESDVADKEIGDQVTIGSQKYAVTQWEVTGSNEDVKRVSIGLRSVDIPSGT